VNSRATSAFIISEPAATREIETLREPRAGQATRSPSPRRTVFF
jgi:hypothetical protein